MEILTSYRWLVAGPREHHLLAPDEQVLGSLKWEAFGGSAVGKWHDRTWMFKRKGGWLTRSAVVTLLDPEGTTSSLQVNWKGECILNLEDKIPLRLSPVGLTQLNWELTTAKKELVARFEPEIHSQILRFYRDSCDVNISQPWASDPRVPALLLGSWYHIYSSKAI